ncbi:MAG: LysM peptidoglycan-binding domain-containing protein [Phycisphaeraceae bacterium]|nr:LysM peptidoglycan-binding domain-containing protein [Phycisphaeraceae bacterium]
MNASYKIVLLGAFVLFAAVVGYYVFSGEDPKPDEFASNDDNPAEQADPAEAIGPGPASEEIEPAPAPSPEPRTTRPTLETREPETEEETIGETPDELPEAPIIGQLAGGEPIERDPLPPFERGPIEEPVTEGPTTTETTGEDPRPAPTPETGDPIEETIDPEPEVEPENEPTRPVPPDPASIPRTYTVQGGDTFASIAAKFYGEERAWFDIAQANPSVDPKRLQVGQEIVLPNRDTVVREREEVQPPAPGKDQNYTVRPGDNLSKIAKKFYGDSEGWDLIYARNRKLIGPRPDALKVGMELIIPQAYSGAE